MLLPNDSGVPRQIERFFGGERRDLPAYLTALANPTRLRILARLAEAGEVNVNDLARHFRMSQPRISWHLRLLRLGGAIRTRREGRLVFCSLDRETMRRRLYELEELLRLREPNASAAIDQKHAQSSLRGVS